MLVSQFHALYYTIIRKKKKKIYNTPNADIGLDWSKAKSQPII